MQRQAVLDARSNGERRIEYPDARQRRPGTGESGEIPRQRGFDRRTAVSVKGSQINLIEKNPAVGLAVVQSRLQRCLERTGKRRLDRRFDVAAELLRLGGRHIGLDLLHLRGGVGTD